MVVQKYNRVKKIYDYGKNYCMLKIEDIYKNLPSVGKITREARNQGWHDLLMRQYGWVL
jgi:hypothetical protein